MEHINTFTGGMNKDISKSLYKEGSYIHAENFSLVTDLGLSTGSLRCSNGNEHFIDFPNCSNVVEITSFPTGATSATVDVNSYIQTYNCSSLEQLGAAMQADINLSLGYYGIAYTDTKIVVYSLLSNNLQVVPNITVSATTPIGALTVNNSYVPAIFNTNIKIIGWVTIRDQIIIFTANTSNPNQVNQTGQIWKLTYDKYSNNPIISLVYNGYLNFSLDTPIANPGAAVGNYETPTIQKVYWSDNYNRPKVLNIANPNAMALAPETLEIVSDTTRGVATIHDVAGGGAIKTGIYQVSARLNVTSGGSTTFLTPSNIVTVINELETVNYANYEARDSGITVGKSILGRLYNLDTQYDRVEPIIIYRETPNATPDIYILPSQPIANNGILEFQYTGNETSIPISLEEFLAEGLVFDTVKTIAAKNNILFFGNLKYSDFDVTFDARAYRFRGTLVSNNLTPKTAVIKEASGVSYTISGPNPNWSLIPTTSDAIQSIDDQAPDTTDNFLFQADGITFGGEGPNVKYEFVVMNSMNDKSASAPFRTILDDSKIYSGNRPAPYAYVKPSNKTANYSLNVPALTGYTQVFQDTVAFDNASGPFGSYTARGYQRDEMYRFGIVFFSKKGQPSYVHWIADIRMPKPWMPSNFYTGPLGPNNRDFFGFPITSVDGQSINSGNSTNNEISVASSLAASNSDKVLYGNNLGIKFTVTLPPNVKSQISGYSIVRVERTEQDKTILGQGMFAPVYYSGVTGSPNFGQWDSQHYMTSNLDSFVSGQGNNLANPFNLNDPTSQGFRNTMGTIASPEFLFKNSPSFVTGDQIDIIQTNACLSDVNMYDGTMTANHGKVYKYYLPCYVRSLAPKAAKIVQQNPGQITDPSQKTPIPLTETVQFYKGQENFSGGALKSWGYSPGGNVNNFGWPGIHSTSGYKPQGDGGTRLFTGFGGDPGGVPIPNFPYRLTGLHSLALGIAAAYPASYGFLTNPNQLWSGLLYQDAITYGGLNVAPTSQGSIYLANYRRSTVVQYGGNTYSERSYNEYISTGHTQIIDANSSSTNSSLVFGGDTYITLFDYADQLRSLQGCIGRGGNDPKDLYDNATRNDVFLIPVECSFPVEWRKQNSVPANAVNDGYTSFPRCAPNKSIIYASMPNQPRISLGNIPTDPNAPSTTAEWTENYDIELDYVAETNTVKYFPLPDPYNPQNIFDVRIHRSQIKTNGELTDSWGIFKPDDYLDLDTLQGPLNNLIIYQNAMLGFQDKGVSIVSVRERSLTQDSSGSEIILGSGGILERYDYISRIIGSRHQFSFTTSHDAVFWFDMNNKNAYKLQGQAPVSITVAKGMSSYMSNNLGGLIQTNDNPYLHKGITSTYDFRFNEAIMTFRDSVIDPNKFVRVIYSGSVPPLYNFSAPFIPLWVIPGSDVMVDIKGVGQYPGVIFNGPSGISVNIPESPIISLTDTINIYSYTKNAFTVGYNDIIDAYTSFYSFTPAVYVNDYVSIFTPDDNLNNLHRHDVGPHATYYGTTYPSKLTLIVNQSPTETKVFDNYEIVCESIDSTGIHQTNDGFKTIRLYNDYQNTDFQTLPIDGTKPIAKRKERTWNLSNLRNRVLYISSNSPDIFSSTELSSPLDKPFGERMRDKYLIVDLEYDNTPDYNFILHTFKTHFRKSAR